jgi:hypothetical protein
MELDFRKNYLTKYGLQRKLSFPSHQRYLYVVTALHHGK